jgi:hypothetical protein
MTDLLTKTDYLLYLESPMHLWAAKHDRLDKVEPNDFDQMMMDQGRDVEALAVEFLRRWAARHHPGAELRFQMPVSEPQYFARLDAALYDPDQDVWDIIEIKSASSVKKEHLYDSAFQRLVVAGNLPLRHSYIVHINKDYRRNGEIDLDTLFVVVNADAETELLLPEVQAGRATAWAVANSAGPEEIETCLKTAGCRCLDLCHPGLPEHSIFDLPRLGAAKLRQLKDAGLVALDQLPVDFPLSDKQQAHANAARRGLPVINQGAIRTALAAMEYPLYFLDYETYNPALPWYDGYGPYQHMVFQFSLHVFESATDSGRHYEYLATEPGDPAAGLVESLLAVIGTRGSVVVWSKAFESGRNRELAARFPWVADRLAEINERIFDLMEVFSQGDYIHPGFHGSASIKKVLPVLVADLDYEDLRVAEGSAAMRAWLEMMKGNLPPEEFDQRRTDLLAYCQRDTWAMVRIWQVLLETVGGI